MHFTSIAVGAVLAATSVSATQVVGYKTCYDPFDPNCYPTCIPENQKFTVNKCGCNPVDTHAFDGIGIDYQGQDVDLFENGDCTGTNHGHYSSSACDDAFSTIRSVLIHC